MLTAFTSRLYQLVDEMNTWRTVDFRIDRERDLRKEIDLIVELVHMLGDDQNRQRNTLQANNLKIFGTPHHLLVCGRTEILNRLITRFD